MPYIFTYFLHLIAYTIQLKIRRGWEFCNRCGLLDFGLAVRPIRLPLHLQAGGAPESMPSLKISAQLPGKMQRAVQLRWAAVTLSLALLVCCCAAQCSSSALPCELQCGAPCTNLNNENQHVQGQQGGEGGPSSLTPASAGRNGSALQEEPMRDLIKRVTGTAAQKALAATQVKRMPLDAASATALRLLNM